jgi:dephospho-CoA kinase
MRLLGLTGGIGMGKSTAADLLRGEGVAVVDTDELARQVVRPGEPALGEIAAAFGAEMIGSDGGLRRAELANVVFADAAARHRLEEILHPRIRALWLAEAEGWREAHVAVGVVVVPLLFETDAAGQFDATICLACSAPTQQDRLLARGWSPTEVRLRLAAQWPIERKMAAATYVVWTEGGLETHAEQLRRIRNC